MVDGSPSEVPSAVLDRLLAATNAHDLAALAGCFAADYHNDTPAHPARGFCGRDQVRANWEQIFAFVPDLTAQVLRRAVDKDTVWSEWEMRGTRRDGSAHAMRGVAIFGICAGAIGWARFYLEPVDEAPDGVDAAVRRQVMRGAGEPA